MIDKVVDHRSKYIVLQVGAILFVICFASYAYYFDNLHFHITNRYAHLGYDVAQHQVGQRHLLGVRTIKDPHKAMEWFKKTADQGHPHAVHNVAIGHLKGIRSDLLTKGEPHKLIQLMLPPKGYKRLKEHSMISAVKADVKAETMGTR